VEEENETDKKESQILMFDSNIFSSQSQEKMSGRREKKMGPCRLRRKRGILRELQGTE